MQFFQSKKNGVVEKVTPVADNTPTATEKKTAQPDVEQAREGVDQHPPMTFKRFMALFSLGCLLAAAQIPLYLIGGALGTTPSFQDLNGSLYSGGHWGRRF
jgi:hypothetical protein